MEENFIMRHLWTACPDVYGNVNYLHCSTILQTRNLILSRVEIVSADLADHLTRKEKKRI